MTPKQWLSGVRQRWYRSQWSCPFIGHWAGVVDGEIRCRRCGKDQSV